MKLEAKQPLTTEELDAINQALSSEPLLVDSVSLFNRYAKRRGEKDLLVRFEPGLTFQVMKIKREANGQLYAIVFEQSQELYCSLNGTDLVNAFGAEGVEVIESSILWAIKQMHRRKAQEEYDGDPAFGRF